MVLSSSFMRLRPLIEALGARVKCDLEFVINSIPLPRLGILFVIVVLFSLVFQVLWGITFFGHVNVVMVDIAALSFAAILFMRLYGKSLYGSRTLILGLVIAICFAIWLGIEAFRSPQLTRGFTLFLILLRDLGIVFAVATTLVWKRDLVLLNKLIFIFGIFIASIFILNYRADFTTFSAISDSDLSQISGLSSSTTIDPNSRVLRLAGFSQGPNFLAIYLSLPFLLGFVVRLKHGGILKWLGIICVGVAMMLTFSRSLWLFLLPSTLLIGIMGAFNKSRAWVRYSASILVPAVILATAILFKFGVLGGSFLGKWYVERFSRIGDTSRLEYWSKLLELSKDSPLIGYGLRMAEVTTGGQYSHNSYIDLILETGVIGLAIYLVFALLVLIRGVKNALILPELIPWVHSWIFLHMMFLTFSLIYNPFVWVVAAVILSRNGESGNSEILND